MSKLKLVPLEVTNLMDIPAMLRKLADEIEANPEVADHVIAILAKPDGAVETRGYGRVGDLAHEIGVMECAKIQLMV